MVSCHSSVPAGWPLRDLGIVLLGHNGDWGLTHLTPQESVHLVGTGHRTTEFADGEMAGNAI